MRRGGRRLLYLSPLAAALLGLLAACGPPTSGLSAEELYREQCARCHGDDGRGDPRQLALSPAVDLTRSRMIRRRARGAIYQRITQGYGSMPAFSYKLERGDVDLLIAHVLKFGEN
ncbi:MAG: cytochrome c [Thermoanaerobaculia bacterium]